MQFLYSVRPQGFAVEPVFWLGTSADRSLARGCSLTRTQTIGLVAALLGALGLSVFAYRHGVTEIITFMPGAIIGTLLSSKTVRLLTRNRAVTRATHAVWTGMGAVLGTAATFAALVAQQGGIGVSSTAEVLRALGQVTQIGVGYGAIIGGIVSQWRETAG